MECQYSESGRNRYLIIYPRKVRKKNGHGNNPSNQIGKDAIYRVFTLRYPKNNDRNKVFHVFRAFRGQSFITMRN